MAQPVNPSRTYDAPRRREQAERTRQVILENARRLFEQDGYGATSMPAIAEQAQVSVKTVYLAFGTKPALLRAVWDHRLAPGEEQAPVLERAWFRELEQDRTADGKLRLAARQSRNVKTRSGDLLEVIRNGAAADPEVAALWDEIQSKLLEVSRALVAQVQLGGGVRRGLDPDRAADVVWTVNHPSTWHLLVRERGWSPEQYEQWILDALRLHLLRS